MGKKAIWTIFISLMVLSLVLASCAPANPQPEAPTNTSTTTPTSTATPAPTTIPTPITKPDAKWWDKFGTPQYGGTITLRLANDVQSFDPYPYTINQQLSMYMESLGKINWTMDRQQNSGAFLTRNRDETIRTGLLAESWDIVDPQTIIFHIHKGIQWQNKSPVNGREFTSDDVVYHYSRMCGLGEFAGEKRTKPSSLELLTSVTTIDKYTVKFKFSTPSLDMLTNLLDDSSFNYIEAREVIQKYGNAQDWHNAVGTGPWNLVDSVPGSSITYSKNPNYWGNSEWYPDNKLPYADGLRFLIIPDDSTTLAAVRTGKIEELDATTIENAQSMKKTNPEIQVGYRAADGTGVWMKISNPLFSDVRVRQALQMAIDRKTLAATYYSGSIDDTPYGLMGPAQQGWYTPYTQWPQSLKDTYAYNPEGAKKLLAEAGYPKGFKTEMHLTAPSVDLMSIAKYQFSQIGVDVTFNVMDNASYNNFTRAGKQPAMTPGRAAGTYPPLIALNQRYSTQTTASNILDVNDPVYDAMVDNFIRATTRDEQKKIAIEADMYDIKQQWTIILAASTVSPYLYQPWLKGFSGEAYPLGYHYARFWIDQTLKTSMGR